MTALIVAILSGGIAIAAVGAHATPEASPHASASLSTRGAIVSPAPGSRTAMPQTQLSFLGIAPSAIGTVTVTGSHSGRHLGRFEDYSTHTGASFLPAKPFRAGETVTVTTDFAVVGATGHEYSFVVATPVAVAYIPNTPKLSTKAPGTAHFLSAPQVTPPTFSMKGSSAGLGADDLVLSPKGNTGSFGPMITTASGRLVYFQALHGMEAMDTKVQTYEGKRVLTWWQGKVVDGHGVGDDVIDNASYQTIATVRAGNGLQADLHEFKLTAQGTALITTYSAIRWNLEPAGGLADGTAWDSIAQEIDVKTGLVMFEWHGLDHVPVGASYFIGPAGSDAPFDWFHINTIEPLAHDRWLISGRDTDAVYEISLPRDGAVLWTLGGKDSNFRFGPGAAFHLQHDPRLRANDTLTVFDNEQPPAVSHALYLHVDMATHVVTLEHSYGHTPPLPTSALGDVEPLPSGDTLVAWGTSTEFSVVSPSGVQVLNGALPGNDDTYRTFAVSWHGTPATPPSVYARQRGSSTLVAVSWNGATAVRTWRVLSGTSAASLGVVATRPDNAFETTLTIPRAGAVSVEALGASGQVLATSKAVAPSP